MKGKAKDVKISDIQRRGRRREDERRERQENQGS